MKISSQEFLANQGLAASGIDAPAVLDDFHEEMAHGLAGSDSSLAMIPTFITVDRPLPADEPVVVLDAGGTNLRVATVVFDRAGKAEIMDFAKYEMPGISAEISGADFFLQFASYLQPVIEKSKKIGFCFSYPAEITPDCDGRLLRWTKEVKAPDVVGKYIGKGLLAALGLKGSGRRVTILNDTIATLLAGKAIGGGRYSSYMGFILGTGTNIAYIEQNSNITKRNDLDVSGSQAINVESGNFDKAPRGHLDEVIDNSTANPGGQKFEKMISGRYFGDLSLLVLQTAAREELFSRQTGQCILAIKELAGRDVDDFLGKAKKSVLADSVFNVDDREYVEELLYGVIDRSAKLTALNLSAAAIKSGAGRNAEYPVCINIDGSTYYKTTDYKRRAESYLAEILGARGVSFDITRTDEAPIIGAAIAGLTQ